MRAGSTNASRVNPLVPLGKVVPSEVAANVAPSEMTAPAADQPAMGVSTTMANAVVEWWDKMVTDSDNLGEPMHIKGLP